MSGKTNFRVGDSVVVNPGVMDPDDSALVLAGWQGRVTEVDVEGGMITFNWDSAALKSIPEDYIRRCELEGLGWETMILEMSEVSPARPRDTQLETEAAYEEIMALHRWDHMADSNPGIYALLAPLGDASETECLDAWEEHLERKLRFPFNARREEQLGRGPVAVGEVVEVLGIAEVDDLYGLLASVKLGRHSYVIPMCDLEATDKSSANYQPLKDYVVWYANR